MTVRSALVAFAALFLTASPLVATPPVDGRPADKAREDRRLPTASDLSGEWRMFLPAGWERIVRIDRLGEDRYYVHPPYVMKGTYEVRGRELTFLCEDRLDGDADPLPNEDAKPRDPTRDVFVWNVRSPYLMTLTSGAGGYRDAILFRSNGREIQDRKIQETAAEPAEEHSSDAARAPSSPFAIDVPQTKLDVKLFPGEKGTQHPKGDLVFPVTIRNDSKHAIELKLPGDRGAETSVAAHVRQIDPSQPEKKTQPTVAMHVYRDGAGAEKPEATILPGESFEFDAKLSWVSAGEPQRRLEPQRRYEIQLSMTFTAEGKLQYLAGPRGSVVTFDPLPLVR